MSCDVRTAGDLEAYAFGECDARAARVVEAHLFGCAGCAAELRRLRAEQRLFRARMEGEAPVAPAFEGVLARIEGDGPARIDIREQAPQRSPQPAGRAAGLRAGSNGGRAAGMVSAVAAVLALAAAFAGVRLDGVGPAAAPTRNAGEAAEIGPEPVCEGAPVCVDVGATLTSEPDDSMRGAVALAAAGGHCREEESGACSGGAARASDVCGSAEASISCDDAVAWCSGSR